LNTITILIIAVGLAMDCFAVSISGGLCLPCMKPKDSLKIAISFGFFQALMPLIGWLLGFSFKDYIAAFDHWIAFGALSLIGLKMIIDAIRHKPEQKKFLITDWKVLLSLSVATSIDALIIGISFAFLEVNISKAILIIGVVTFIISLIGLFIGRKASRFTGSKAEIIGGIFLILIGSKILFEHLSLINW